MHYRNWGIIGIEVWVNLFTGMMTVGGGRPEGQQLVKLLVKAPKPFTSRSSILVEVC